MLKAKEEESRKSPVTNGIRDETRSNNVAQVNKGIVKFQKLYPPGKVISSPSIHEIFSRIELRKMKIRSRFFFPYVNFFPQFQFERKREGFEKRFPFSIPSRD